MPVLCCVGCGRAKLQGEYGCPACGAEVYGTAVPASARPRPAPEPPPVFGVLAGAIIVPTTAIVLLHGPQGIGKSTVALEMFARPWIITAEMAPPLVLQFCERAGLTRAGISQPEWTPEAELVHLGISREELGADVMFDSLTAYGHPVEALAAVRAYVLKYNARAVVIVQNTKDGSPRGSATLGYDVDIVLRMEESAGKRRIVVEKNRFGPGTTISYSLGDKGVEKPVFTRYYSVEGSLGTYRLVRHPGGKRARYADYLRYAETAEEHHLPPPPLAVTAQRSNLYRGGWIEPDDWAERAQFARRAGIPHFSPVPAE